MIIRFVACIGLFTLVVTPAKAWCSGPIEAIGACKVGLPEDIEERDNPDQSRDLSLSQEKIGTEQWANGDLAGALESFKKAFAVLDSRARTDPENTQLQRGLSRILNNIASLQIVTGNREEARATYTEVFAIEEKLAGAIEKAEVKSYGMPGRATASAFGNVAWYALLARNPTKALGFASQALAITPEEPWVRINLAHALLLLGRAAEAKAIYVQVAAIPNKPWRQIIVEDFGKLRKAGVTHSLMPTIEAALNR
jgi:tetratricopeptide (TPR) repeat protein